MSDNHSSNHDAVQQAIDGFRHMSVPDRPADSAVVARLEANQLTTARLSTPLSTKRRFVMRALVPSSVAATLIIGLLATFLWTNPSSSAIAQVLEAAEMHKLVKYKVTQTTDDKRYGTNSATSVMYADLAAPRYREERQALTWNDTVETDFVYIQNGPKNRALAVLTEAVVPDAERDGGKSTIAKAYKEKHGDGRREASLSPVAEASQQAQPLLESLRELERHKDIVTSREKLNGLDTVQYYLEQDKKTTKLWIDTKTNLPVQLEYEMLEPTSDIAVNRWVLSDFEWDPQVQGFSTLDAIFDTTPPEGYTLTDRTIESPPR
ncbi:MAG: hypothetical protein KF708_13600 [Pirellulales bacterium]|nr:hypothetical protein [Pirellulales bacterium]